MHLIYIKITQYNVVDFSIINEHIIYKAGHLVLWLVAIVSASRLIPFTPGPGCQGDIYPWINLSCISERRGGL